MDIEKLEKLNELKEKGIITKEEFDVKKKELLGIESVKKENNSKKNGINWKNLGLSFLIGFVLFVLSMVVSAVVKYIAGSESDSYHSIKIFFAIIGVIMAIIASKYETKKYKNSSPSWGVFIGVLFFGSLGVWIISYDLLQIKDGLKELKEPKKEK